MEAPWKVKPQTIMKPGEMVHFYDIQYQMQPFFRGMYHKLIRLHGYFFIPGLYLWYKIHNADFYQNPPESAKNGSRYYWMSRLIYAVKYQDAELMAKLEHHPRRLDNVWYHMKHKYDLERQHTPVSPAHKAWWEEYKRKNPRFA